MGIQDKFKDLASKPFEGTERGTAEDETAQRAAEALADAKDKPQDAGEKAAKLHARDDRDA